MAVSVTFGGAPGTGVTVNSDTELTVTTPAGTGLVDLTVTTAGGADTLDDAFTYQAPAPPTLDSVSPTSGVEGVNQQLTLTGTGLDQVGPSPLPYFVQVIDTTGTAVSSPTSVTHDGSTGLTFGSTALRPAVYGVRVRQRGTSTDADVLPDSYTVNAFSPTPTLTAITPNTGATSGQQVTLTGTGFLAGVAWRVRMRPTGGGTPVAFTSVTRSNDTTIVANFPTAAVAAGTWDVELYWGNSIGSDPSTATLPSGYTQT